MKIAWRAKAPGQYIELEWRNGDIYLEDGPDEWPRRGHEGGGGTFTLQEVRRRGPDWFSAYDGFYERVMDDLALELRISDAPSGVVATLADALVPHQTPCRFAFNGSRVYVYPATSEPSEHVAKGSSASLLVAASGEEHVGNAPDWWGRVQGRAAVVDDPEWELARAAELFAEKYGQLVALDVPTLRIDIDEFAAHPNDAT